MRTIDDARNRLRAEFLEMPGMRLKPEQVQRLCGVERGLCQTVLDSLVDARFLCVSADGQYARATDGKVSGQPQLSTRPAVEACKIALVRQSHQNRVSAPDIVLNHGDSFALTGESEEALGKALALIGESATGRTAKDRQ